MNVDFKAGISGIVRVEGCIWQIFQEWVSDSPFNMTSNRRKWWTLLPRTFRRQILQWIGEDWRGEKEGGIAEPMFRG